MCHNNTDHGLANLPLDVWDCIALFLSLNDVTAVCLVGMRAVSNHIRHFHMIRCMPLLATTGPLGVRTLTLWTAGLEMRHIHHMGRIMRRDLPLLVRINANIGLTSQSFGAMKHFLRTIGRSCFGLRMFCLRLSGVKPACNLNGVRHMLNLHHLSVVILTGNLSDPGVIQLTNGLRTLHTLEHVELQLERNEISDAGASVIGTTLRGLKWLRSVHLSVAFNPITRVGLDAICEQRPDGWSSLQLDTQGTPGASGTLLLRAPTLRHLHLELSAHHAVVLVWNGLPDHLVTFRLFVHVASVADSLALWTLLGWIQRDTSLRRRCATWRIVASRPCGTCMVVRTACDTATVSMHLAGHAPMRQFLYAVHPTSLHIDVDNRRVWGDNHTIRDIPHSVECLRLQLNACDVGLAAIGALARLPRLADLWLQGRHNRWNGHDGLLFGHFASCASLRTLTLDLVDNDLGDVGVTGLMALAAAPHLECIVLWLGHNNVSPATAHSLWMALVLPTRTVTIHL